MRVGHTCFVAKRSLNVAGLFAGIGGIELGLRRAGHHSSLLCEIDPGANAVLRERFPDAVLADDVREIKSIGKVDLLAAGFPCQDLSQAGRTAGIDGRNSGLVGHVFRLLDAAPKGPRWLLLENVSFMLQLDRGRGMRLLVDELESRGFHWAYRVVDTQAFGLPQRRQRVILLASRTEDPREVLFVDDVGPAVTEFRPGMWCGFYWTEGLRGLGWAVDAVPTLKGGSTIGIPSPPAIWNSGDGSFGTPDIRDAERLQGFDADWTLPSFESGATRRSHRWKLVGNAVSVPVARWVGERLADPGRFDSSRLGDVVRPGVSWPRAACGGRGRDAREASLSMWPMARSRESLASFLRFSVAPLSARAAAGFKNRLDVSGLSYPEEFGQTLARYVECATRPSAVA